MNKELIKKYEAEFKHWLNEGEILYYFKNQWDELKADSTIAFNWGYPELIDSIVINDEYVEFRKALAEGKTVQAVIDMEGNYRDITDVVIDVKDYHVEELRIKPDEPQFKVGDWVTTPAKLKNDGDEIRILGRVQADLTIEVFETSFVFYTASLEKAEPWQPKPGEWCFDKKYGFVQVKTVYSNKVECKSYEDYSKSWYRSINCYNLEPFIGTLPTFIKD